MVWFCEACLYCFNGWLLHSVGVPCSAANSVLALSWELNFKYIKFNIIPQFLRCFRECKLRSPTLLGHISNKNLTFIWIIPSVRKANLELQGLRSAVLEATNWLLAGVREQAVPSLQQSAPKLLLCLLFQQKARYEFTPSSKQIAGVVASWKRCGLKVALPS